MTDWVSAVMNPLKSAGEMAKGLVEIRDTVKFGNAVIELQAQIMAAQQGAFAAQARETNLAEKVRELEEEMTRLKTWEAEKQHYELKAVDRGAFAYVPKKQMQGTEPPHWLCASCFEKSHKSILQFKEQIRNPSGIRRDRSSWVCGTCAAELNVNLNISPC